MSRIVLKSFILGFLQLGLRLLLITHAIILNGLISVRQFMTFLAVRVAAFGVLRNDIAEGISIRVKLCALIMLVGWLMCLVAVVVVCVDILTHGRDGSKRVLFHI
jgi:hypothetical protein